LEITYVFELKLTKMKKFLLWICSAITALSSFAQNPNLLSDKNAQARSVKTFHAIEVSGGIDLYLSQGNEALAVSASDAEFRDRITTQVDNGVLRIYMNTESGFHNWGNHKLKAYVAFANIDALNASGGSDVYSYGTFKLNNLSLELSGGSDLKHAKFELNDLSITQTGGSDAYISGTASRLKIVASGGSDLHAFGFVTENCDISASGGSDTQITVNKELNVSASGGSDVYYKGSAVIRELRSSGSSSVSKRG
jgi:hypothetical protein